LIFRQMSEEKVEGIKKIWVGEIKYVLWLFNITFLFYPS
jgi:hypothetical protein